MDDTKRKKQGEEEGRGEEGARFRERTGGRVARAAARNFNLPTSGEPPPPHSSAGFLM